MHSCPPKSDDTLIPKARLKMGATIVKNITKEFKSSASKNSYGLSVPSLI